MVMEQTANLSVVNTSLVGSSPSPSAKTVVCHFTGKTVLLSDAMTVGATVPGVKAWHYKAKGPEAEAARKASGIAFAEMDANCNTCKHLQRVQHARHFAGMLKGRCTAKAPRFDVHPYTNMPEGVMTFHPDDWMGMPCYESRWL